MKNTPTSDGERTMKEEMSKVLFDSKKAKNTVVGGEM
jgi:hypothetical protein